MNSEKKLKECISKCDYEEAVKNAPYSALSKWFLEILNKSLKQLSNFDLIRCIRQKVFTKEAVFEIVQRMMISGTPLYAGFESVEIMEKLSSVETSILIKYRAELIDLIDTMLNTNQIADFVEWVDDEEINEYMNYVERIREKIK